jgi:hypothetical protein
VIESYLWTQKKKLGRSLGKSRKTPGGKKQGGAAINGNFILADWV